MIIGTGIDIVEIARVREAANKWGERFLKRIFTKHEIEYCFSKRDPFPGLSARFAAKEATIKALSGLVKDHHIAFNEIEVSNEPSGKPFIILCDEINDHLPEKVILHLSLTHERTHALATVIAEKSES